MAIGGKTLGIVSGLAVGVTSGVFLAALNPIVPPSGNPVASVAVDQVTDLTETEQTTEPALPKLSMVETSTDPDPEPELAPDPVVDPIDPDPVAIVTPKPDDAPAPTEIAALDEPAQVETPQEPIIDEPELSAEPPQTVALDPLAPVVTPNTELALVLPENTQAGAVSTAPDQPDSTQNDAQPNVSNTPAAAVQLAEPSLETESPNVNEAAPADAQTVETATVALPEETTEPAQILPNETVVAALPDVQNPDAPIPAVAVIDDADAPAPKIAPNTSGTFKTTGGSIISRAGSSTLGGDTKSSRFKTIGDSSKISDAAPDTSDNTASPDLGALVRNAVEFPVTDAPLMSVILLDNGTIAAQLPSLAGLNLPLTIAISLDEADAAERAAQYYAAGFEVLAMSPRNVKLSLSGGQSNDQVAALLNQYFEIMPTAIGLIDRPSANLQKDQRLSRAVVQQFVKSGHGLITYAGGLNGTKRAADQENVANGTVFRFLDKSGEAGQIITQQLDRAAREARRSGSVIVMATPSRSTLGTLLSWSLSSNGRAVTLAPVSASLLKN